MTTTTARAASRIELRATDEIKELLTTAAAYTGIDLTSFVLSNVVPVAREIVERKERLIVDAVDYAAALDLLDNPPEPPAALLKAARNHGKGHGIRTDNAGTIEAAQRKAVRLRKA